MATIVYSMSGEGRGHAARAQVLIEELRKPGNFEQSVNGYFLHASGQGQAIPVEHFQGDAVRSFIESTPRYADRIRPERLNGNRATLAAIEGELHAARDHARATLPSRFAWDPLRNFSRGV